MKRILSTVLCMLVIFVVNVPMYASSVAFGDTGSYGSANKTGASTDYNISSLGSANLGEVQTKGLTLLGTLQWVGYLVAIGMIIWVGIKYLMSGAGEKAKAKETLVPIVIGAILIAGATWIASALFTALG